MFINNLALEPYNLKAYTQTRIYQAARLGSNTLASLGACRKSDNLFTCHDSGDHIAHSVAGSVCVDDEPSSPREQ